MADEKRFGEAVAAKRREQSEDVASANVAAMERIRRIQDEEQARARYQPKSEADALKLALFSAADTSDDTPSAAGTLRLTQQRTMLVGGVPHCQAELARLLTIEISSDADKPEKAAPQQQAVRGKGKGGKAAVVGRTGERPAVMEKGDIMLDCRECKSEFTFSERDQAFFGEKGYEQPVRCKDCRAAKAGEVDCRDRTINDEREDQRSEGAGRGRGRGRGAKLSRADPSKVPSNVPSTGGGKCAAELGSESSVLHQKAKAGRGSSEGTVWVCVACNRRLMCNTCDACEAVRDGTPSNVPSNIESNVPLNFPSTVLPSSDAVRSRAAKEAAERKMADAVAAYEAKKMARKGTQQKEAAVEQADGPSLVSTDETGRGRGGGRRGRGRSRQLPR